MQSCRNREYVVVSHSFGCWSPSEYINADNSKQLGLLGDTENYNLQISLLHIIPEQPWPFHELFLLSVDEVTLIYFYWSSPIHSYWQQGGAYSWNESHIATPCNLYGKKWNFQNIFLSSPQLTMEYKTPTKTQAIVGHRYFSHTWSRWSCRIFFKLKQQQYKAMIGLSDTKIWITLLFYVCHGFLMQQFRTLLNCFSFIYNCIWWK